MKTRTTLLIGFIILLLLVLFILPFLPFAYSASLSPSATSTATVTPSPTQTLPDKIATGVDNVNKGIISPLQALLNLFATLIIIVIAVLLIRRIWKLSAMSNLVIDTFTNATANKDFDSVHPGLNLEMRRILVTVVEQVRQRIIKYRDQGPSEYHPPDQAPPPELSAGDSLNTLLTSLKGLTSGQVQVAIQLIGLVFTQQGTKVSTTLQSNNDTPPTFSISLEVTDLQGQQKPTLFTMSEPSHSSNQVASPQQATISSPSASNSSQQPDSASSPSSSSSSQQQAECYYEVGMALDTVGLYKDAISYFEKALVSNKKLEKAAKALAETVSRLQIQQSGVSAYTVGKQLQDAGLYSAAIESYKKPLISTDQANAETAWEAVLKPSGDNATTSNEANAYFTLAKLYRKDNVYLFDQSLDLYKAAVAHGSHAAADKLEKIQQADANSLTQVGQLLFGLTQYAAAEEYLKAALAKVPTYSQAQTALATVERNKPPEENKDALACYTLGSIYEERMDFDQAKSQYQNALTKQPDYDRARDALKRVLDVMRTPEERFQDLLQPVARWLAIELAQRSMEADRQSIKKENRTRYDAEIYNFIGDFYEASAFTFYTYPQFYRLAIEDFQKASKKSFRAN